MGKEDGGDGGVHRGKVPSRPTQDSTLFQAVKGFLTAPRTALELEEGREAKPIRRSRSMPYIATCNSSVSLVSNSHRCQVPVSHMLGVSNSTWTDSHSYLSSEAVSTTMSLDIFDKFRRSSTKFRTDRPGSRPDAAICSALLPPNILRSVSPTDLEYVSGGCWSEVREASALTTKNSSGVSRPRKSCWSWQGLDCLDRDKEEFTGATNLTLSASNRSLGAPDQRCAYTFEPKTRSLPPPHPRLHAWLDQSSPALSSDATSVDSCVNCPERYDQTQREELFGRGRDTLGRVGPKGDLKTQNVLRSMRTGSCEDKAYDSDARSDFDSHRDALRVVSAQESASTDAISTTASSAVLGPALLPKIVSGQMLADEGSDCDSPSTGSAYSIEADEMIKIQSQDWKRLFWDAWHRTRSKRRLKGRRADAPRCSFTI